MPQSTSGAALVVVVDDAPDVRLLARAALERRGFAVLEAEDGETALVLVAAGGVDLVLLDVNLPRMSGLAVLARLREQESLPVILLTSLNEESDRVLGLEIGADDYVAKPFSPTELGARVAAVLRRTGPRTPAAGPAVGAEEAAVGVQIDMEERQVRVNGVPVELTPKEFDLLARLASAPRRVFTRADLLADVWGSALDWQDPATVTEHVRRLRLKIESDPANPRWLHTVRGIGYRFVPGGPDAGAECSPATVGN